METSKSTLTSNSLPQKDDVWEVSIPEGTCTCPSFTSSHIPCKHMFAIFYHYPTWSWHNLPPELTKSAHMVLDTDTTCAVDHHLVTAFCEGETFNDSTHKTSALPPESPSVPSSGPLPPRNTHGKQLYSLQKKLEETLGHCRTLAFLTSDIPALESALQQCTGVLDTLTSAAATTAGPNIPPVFHTISKAGVEEFRLTTKTLYRTGSKRKQKLQTPEHSQSPKRVKHDGQTQTMPQTSNQLVHLVKRTAGRPKLKRAQRKRPPFPRQVSSETRANMAKAAAILRRGKKYIYSSSCTM